MEKHTSRLRFLGGLTGFAALAMMGLTSCATATGSKPAAAVVVAKADKDGRWKKYQDGTASWYGGRWHGRLTANGERYNQHTMTAAHKKLPFGTRVRVTNTRNGKTCVVRINNRGPYVRGRVIDLSVAAAKELGFHSNGITQVSLEVLN